VKRRSCGSCTMCCKTMGVADLLPERKLPGKWCEHCDKGVGCRVYADRPTTCREFECVWLQGGAADVLTDDMRPDKIAVVFQPTNDGKGLVAHCNPDQPLAWMKPKPLATLRACAKAGFHASARAGDRYWVVTSRTEWPVPEEFIIRGPNESVDVRIPHDIAREIGVRT